MKKIKIKTAKRQKGIALILVLSVITVLVTLAMGMSVMMRYDEKTTLEITYDTLARFGAEAGFKRAIIELRKHSLNTFFDTTNDDWYYKDTTKPSFDKLDTVVGNSVSMEIEDKNTNIRTEIILKVVDCASKIYINSNYQGVNESANIKQRSLYRLLNNLILHLIKKGASFLNNSDALTLLNARGNIPFKNEEDLISRWASASGNPKSTIEKKWDELKDYVTLYGYDNPKTCEIFDEDTDGKIYEFQPRAPININTASEPVLVAVLSGLYARNLCPNCSGDGKTYLKCPYCNNGNIQVGYGDAINVANWIISNRPFKSWSEFYHKLKNDRTSPLKGSVKCDVIMANCNPNPGWYSGSRDYTWGERAGFISKCAMAYNHNCRLMFNTTEFCFNSGGWYEVESTAKVYVGGQLKAIRMAKGYVKIFGQINITNQYDFMKDAKVDGLLTYPESIGYMGGNPKNPSLNPGDPNKAAKFDGYVMRDFVYHTTPNSGTHLNLPLKGTIMPESCGNINKNPLYKNKINEGNSVYSISPSMITNQGLLVLKCIKDEYGFRAKNNVPEQRALISLWYKPVTNMLDESFYTLNGDYTYKTFVYIAEQPGVKRWTVSQGTDPKNGYDCWAVERTDNRGVVLFWWWPNNGTIGQHCGILTLGTSDYYGGATNPHWEWMVLNNNGMGKSSYNTDPKKYLFKGEWVHVAAWYQDCVFPDVNPFPANDRGWTSSYPSTYHYPDPTSPGAYFHWNAKAIQKNPEAISKGGYIKGINLGNPYDAANRTAPMKQDEKHFYINGKLNSSGSWGYSDSGYVTMGPFVDGPNAYITIGFSDDFWKHRKCQYADGYIADVRIWDESKFSSARSVNDMTTIVNNIYLDGRYYDQGGHEERLYLLPNNKSFKKEKGSIWGCMFWTQYEPKYVDYSMGQSYTKIIVKDSNGLIEVSRGFATDPRSTKLSRIAGGKGLNKNNDYFHFEIRFGDRSVASHPLIDTTIVDDIWVTYLPNPKIKNYILK